jgi:rhodanese-related sulfurtransferase
VTQSNEVEAVDPAGAEQLLADGALLVDVREPEEWQAGHAAQAVHVPLGELGARLDELPTDGTLVMVCRSGGRSGHAATALIGAGRRAVNLAGGMQAWAAAGYDVVTDNGGAGTVI